MVNDVSVLTQSAGALPVSLGAIFRTFLKAGLVSFGGGAVAYQREYVVSTNKWFDDEGFLDILEISQALPGLNSVNLSVIVGDKLAGIPGAGAAVFGFILPGAIVIMALGVAWRAQEHNPNVRAFLIGVAAAAVGLLSTVTLRLGRKQFTNPLDLGIILASFVAVSFLRVPLYLVLLVIGPAAVWLYHPVPKVRTARSAPGIFASVCVIATSFTAATDRSLEHVQVDQPDLGICPAINSRYRRRHGSVAGDGASHDQSFPLDNSG